MQTSKSDIPYRQSVYGLMLNTNGQILIVFKKNAKRWDFPGGGIDSGESFEQAMKREISEELGTDKISILSVSDVTYKYDWPETEMEKNFNKTGIWKRGQEQHFAIIKYFGDDNAIKLQEEELLEYKWVNKENLQQYMSYPDQYDTVLKVMPEFN